MRIPVDYLIGERRQPKRALHKVHDEIFRRISPALDWKMIDYYSPLSALRTLKLKFVFGLSYASSEVIHPLAVGMKIRKGSIYHIHNQKLGSILHYIRLTPSLLTCHDIIEYVRPEYNENPFVRVYIRWYHLGAMKADRLIVPSEFTKQDIVRHFGYRGSNIDVVPNGIDHDVFRPRPGKSFLKLQSYPEDRKYILHVGSEQPRKNVDLLVEAFLLALKKRRDLTLIRVGAPDEIPGHPVRARILKMLRDADAMNRVIFLENLSEETLATVYNSADLLVFPSSYEGFGLPPLEAMASGIPVITSNTTAIPEVVGDAALMVSPDDPQGIADSILSLLDNSSLQQDLIRRGLERARLFNWDRSAARTLEIYEQVASRFGISTER
jgi:glycosyltransferase involved in cell wall biosynthesis